MRNCCDTKLQLYEMINLIFDVKYVLFTTKICNVLKFVIFLQKFLISEQKFEIRWNSQFHESQFYMKRFWFVPKSIFYRKKFQHEVESWDFTSKMLLLYDRSLDFTRKTQNPAKCVISTTKCFFPLEKSER